MRSWICLGLSALLVLIGSRADARKWTSRDGRYTVEAELVDFQDGKAVLKREDGKLIRVPLSDLSLGDVHYVQESLKAAGRDLPRKPGPPPAKQRPAVAVHGGEPPLSQPGVGKWQVVVDPPALPLQLPAEHEISIRVPVEFGKPLILYPSAPSPFVVLGHGRHEGVRRVWDLRTRRKGAGRLVQ